MELFDKYLEEKNNTVVAKLRLTKKEIASQFFSKHPNAINGRWNFFKQEKQSDHTAFFDSDGQPYIVEYNCGRGAYFIAVGDADGFYIK